MANEYQEPINYGETFGDIEVDVAYGLRLSSDIINTGKPNTLPLFRRDDLEYAYTKNVKRTGDSSNEISWKRIAHYRPVSRPYGETIQSDEGTTIPVAGLVYATKYLPRADELTAYVDLNAGNLYGEKDGFVDFEPIVMGDQVPTPTPSWTPTMSWTPTITQTITDTQMATPTPSPTESPDLESLGRIFRELWKDDSPDYFTFKYLNGYFGIRFRYRKYAMHFYENYEETVIDSFLKRQYFGAKHLTDKEKIFNPFRKIQIYTRNVIVPDTKYDASDQTIEVTEDHMAIDIPKTFGSGSDDDFGSRANFEAMVRTNAGTDEVAGTFNYSARNVKRLTETNGGTETQIGYEIAIPFENFRTNESVRYKSDGSDRVVNQYNRFVNKRDTSLPDFNNNKDNRFDCKYYIFEANLTGEIDVSKIIIHPSKEEEDWFIDTSNESGLGTWETDVPTYSTDHIDIFEHGETIGGEKLYLFTMPTPTPSFTPSPSPTVTITHPTPTPTFTISPTETLSNTPTPTVTITHPTPTPSPTITKTLRLFNVNEEKGVNIIGTMNIIQRDGTITYADNLFNLGPVFHLELDI